MLSGQAATVVLTFAVWSVAVPLKLMVAGGLTAAVGVAARAIEPPKASGASSANGMAMLAASSVTAASLTCAGLANVSSSQTRLPPRTATLAISTFHGFGAVRGDPGAVLASFWVSFWPVSPCLYARPAPDLIAPELPVSVTGSRFNRPARSRLMFRAGLLNAMPESLTDWASGRTSSMTILSWSKPNKALPDLSCTLTLSAVTRPDSLTTVAGVCSNATLTSALMTAAVSL